MEFYFYSPWYSRSPPEQLLTEKPKTAQKLMKQGYVHYHELVYATGLNAGQEAEDIVVYLKHIAVREFYFDGGPMAPMSNHQVYPGIDYDFMPNWP